MNRAECVQKTIGYEKKIQIPYKDFEQLKYELEKNKIRITKTEYKENIEISIEIPEEKVELLEKMSIKAQNSTKKYVEI